MDDKKEADVNDTDEEEGLVEEVNDEDENRDGLKAPPPPYEVQPSTSAGAPFTSNYNSKKKKMAARDAKNLKNKGKKKWMIRKKPMSMILMKKT
jgi:hypothetical protein